MIKWDILYMSYMWLHRYYSQLYVANIFNSIGTISSTQIVKKFSCLEKIPSKRMVKPDARKKTTRQLSENFHFFIFQLSKLLTIAIFNCTLWSFIQSRYHNTYSITNLQGNFFILLFSKRIKHQEKKKKGS